MFYTDSPDTNKLRFGDILTDLILTTPRVDDFPINGSYNIEIKKTNYYAILTPCCSIKESTISIVPLTKIQKSFYKNPHFRNDLTIINRAMPAEKSMPPEKWSSLSPEDQEERKQAGVTYAFNSIFIYSPHDLLESYTFSIRQEEIELRYYMINFKDICTVYCNKIKRAENSPTSSKLLELSVDTREELRSKIRAFYCREPAEDRI